MFELLELMNPVALELGVERRREIAEETMRASRAAEVRSRQAADGVIALVDKNVGGPELSPRQLQPTSDCI